MVDDMSKADDGSRKPGPAASTRPRVGAHTLIGPHAQVSFGMLLTAIAGYVDAIGYIELGGLFASFMSGATISLRVGSLPASRVSGPCRPSCCWKADSSLARLS
jgi:hypothetical protein